VWCRLQCRLAYCVWPRPWLSCLYPPGASTTFTDGMRCESCTNTSYTGGGRFDCPTHSLTEFFHADSSPSDIEDCVCEPSYNRTEDVRAGAAGCFLLPGRSGAAVPAVPADVPAGPKSAGTVRVRAMNMYIYIYTYICVYIYVHIYIYIYININI